MAEINRIAYKCLLGNPDTKDHADFHLNEASTACESAYPIVETCFRPTESVSLAASYTNAMIQKRQPHCEEWYCVLELAVELVKYEIKMSGTDTLNSVMPDQDAREWYQKIQETLVMVNNDRRRKINA